MTVPTRRLRLLVAAFLLLGLSAASASEVYFGISGDVAFIIQGETIVPQVAVVSPGAQLGVRELLGPLGLRATAEYSVYPSTGLFEGALDLTLDLGTAVDPYAGVGIGIATLDGSAAGLARLFAGIAPRLSPATGLFGEALINAFADSAGQAYTLKARGGFNIYF